MLKRAIQTLTLSIFIFGHTELSAKISLSCFGQEKDYIAVSNDQLTSSNVQWEGSCYSHPPAILSSAVNFRRTGVLEKFSEEYIAYRTSLDCPGEVQRQACQRGFFISGFLNKTQDALLENQTYYREDYRFNSDMQRLLDKSTDVLEEDKALYEKLITSLLSLRTHKTVEEDRVKNEIKAWQKHKLFLENSLKDEHSKITQLEIIAKIEKASRKIQELESALKSLQAQNNYDDEKKRITEQIKSLLEKHNIEDALRSRLENFLEDHNDKLVIIDNLKKYDLDLKKDSNTSSFEEPQFVGQYSCTPEENQAILHEIEDALCMNFPIAISTQTGSLEKRKFSQRRPGPWLNFESNSTHAMVAKSLEFVGDQLYLKFQNSYGKDSEARLAYEDFCAINYGYILLDEKGSGNGTSEWSRWTSYKKEYPENNALTLQFSDESSETPENH